MKQSLVKMSNILELKAPIPHKLEVSQWRSQSIQGGRDILFGLKVNAHKTVNRFCNDVFVALQCSLGQPEMKAPLSNIYFGRVLFR